MYMYKPNIVIAERLFMNSTHKRTYNSIKMRINTGKVSYIKITNFSAALRLFPFCELFHCTVDQTLHFLHK